MSTQNINIHGIICWPWNSSPPWLFLPINFLNLTKFSVVFWVDFTHSNFFTTSKCVYEYKKIVFVENVDKNEMIYIICNKQLTQVPIRGPKEQNFMDSTLFPVQRSGEKNLPVRISIQLIKSRKFLTVVSRKFCSYIYFDFCHYYNTHHTFVLKMEQVFIRVITVELHLSGL